MGFIAPYIINPDEGKLGAKVGFVFFGPNIIASIVVLFNVPESIRYENQKEEAVEQWNCSSNAVLDGMLVRLILVDMYICHERKRRTTGDCNTNWKYASTNFNVLTNLGRLILAS